MLTYIFYTKGSPHEREAEHFKTELERHKVEVKLVEADSPEGMRLTELYEILGRPAVAVIGPQGQLMGSWQQTWPLVSEVSYTAHQ